MTYAPAALKAAQVYLRERTSLPWVSLGIVGDADHRGGYHQGEPNVPASDYSRDESTRDENGLSGAASALDIGDFPRLRELSLWIVAQCKAGAPDTRDIREVIYTPDGRTVARWDRLGIRSSGDSSHLSHTHISYHRDSEARDKVGLFRRFFEGDDDMQLSDRIDYSAWYKTTYGAASGTVEQTLSNVVAYSRNASDKTALVKAEQAKQTVLLQQILAKQSGLTQAQVAAAVADGVRQAMPSVEEIAAAVAAAVDHDLDTAAVEEALRNVLGGVDETTGAGA